MFLLTFNCSDDKSGEDKSDAGAFAMNAPGFRLLAELLLDPNPSGSVSASTVDLSTDFIYDEANLCIFLSLEKC